MVIISVPVVKDKGVTNKMLGFKSAQLQYIKEVLPEIRLIMKFRDVDSG